MPYTSPVLSLSVDPDEPGATLHVVDVAGKPVSFTRNDVGEDITVTVNDPGTYHVVVLTSQLERRSRATFTIAPASGGDGGGGEPNPNVGPAVWMHEQDPPPDPEAFPFWVRIS